MTRMTPRADPVQDHPPRITDRPGPVMRSLITEWKNQITTAFSLCLVVAATLYVLDKPLAGFVDQLSGVLTGTAILAMCLACVRIFAAVRQMAGAEKQAGGARSEVAELRAEVAALKEMLAPFVLMVTDGRPERGGGRRREDTTPIDLG